MIRLSLIVCLLVTFQSVYSQSESSGVWLIQGSLGIEAHDKRLFNYNEKKLLLQRQPEYWGTYHLTVNAKRQLLHSKRLSVFAGLGLGYELATFNRPFDKSLFDKDNFRVLLGTNKYSKLFIPITLTSFLHITDRWSLSAELSSNMLFYRHIDIFRRSRLFPYTHYTFALDEAHAKVGINYAFDKWMIGLNSRLINFQQVDKIIFNRLMGDPIIYESWEKYNPLRFDITFGMRL